MVKGNAPLSERPFTGFTCLSRAGEPTRHCAALGAADASLGMVKGNAPLVPSREAKRSGRGKQPEGLPGWVVLNNCAAAGP